MFSILNCFVLVGIESLAVNGWCYLWTNGLVKSPYYRMLKAWDSLAISAFLSFKFTFYNLWIFCYMINSQRKWFSENLMQFFWKVRHSSIRRLKVYWKFEVEKSKKIISYKWNKSVFRKMMHISKTGCKNLQILEISHGKSHNSGTSLDNTWVFTIAGKYLHLYGINRRIKESSARKLW